MHCVFLHGCVFFRSFLENALRQTKERFLNLKLSVLVPKSSADRTPVVGRAPYRLFLLTRADCAQARWRGMSPFSCSRRRPGCEIQRPKDPSAWLRNSGSDFIHGPAGRPRLPLTLSSIEHLVLRGEQAAVSRRPELLSALALHRVLASLPARWSQEPQ